jgi:hypothetical protein
MPPFAFQFFDDSPAETVGFDLLQPFAGLQATGQCDLCHSLSAICACKSGGHRICIPHLAQNAKQVARAVLKRLGKVFVDDGRKGKQSQCGTSAK